MKILHTAFGMNKSNTRELFRHIDLNEDGKISYGNITGVILTITIASYFKTIVSESNISCYTKHTGN